MKECSTSLPILYNEGSGNKEQAGAELGQAQQKLGLDSTLIFYKFIYKFGFYRLSRNIEKIIQRSPLLIIFKGNRKIAHL